MIMLSTISLEVLLLKFIGICQIRLDFDTFDIADPATTGACNTDYFDAVGGTGSNPPRICGSSTGQHSNATSITT